MSISGKFTIDVFYYQCDLCDHNVYSPEYIYVVNEAKGYRTARPDFVLDDGTLCRRERSS